MVDFTYYCKIVKDFPTAGIKAGVYSCTSSGKRTSREFMVLTRYSDKVWRQGPRGGVKTIKDRGARYSVRYVTNEVEEMKKFMWAKLQAQPIK